MIGYYVHHQGRGHLTRATSIARELRHRVVALSSLSPPAAEMPFTDWIRLPGDDTAAVGTDPTAGGALHWAPRLDAGLRDRMAALAAWVARCRPSAVVVDVSVEVAVFLRLLGVPVLIVAQPGDRDDEAHQLAYRLADAILAFWTREVYDPPWLTAHADRTHYVGALSRFDGRDRPATAAGDRAAGVLLSGAGGIDITSSQYQALPTDLSWRLLGPPTTPEAAGGAGPAWVADPWPLLCAADVVVTHAGQNAVAEVAAAGRPAVILPQPRPHAEQLRTAQALAEAGLARVPRAWPAAADWPGELAAARALGGGGWSRWLPGDAAARAATAIETVAPDHRAVTCARA